MPDIALRNLTRSSRPDRAAPHAQDAGGFDLELQRPASCLGSLRPPRYETLPHFRPIVIQGTAPAPRRRANPWVVGGLAGVGGFVLGLTVGFVGARGHLGGSGYASNSVAGNADAGAAGQAPATGADVIGGNIGNRMVSAGQPGLDVSVGAQPTALAVSPVGQGGAHGLSAID